MSPGSSTPVLSSINTCQVAGSVVDPSFCMSLHSTHRNSPMPSPSKSMTRAKTEDNVGAPDHASQSVAMAACVGVEVKSLLADELLTPANVTRPLSLTEMVEPTL